MDGKIAVALLVLVGGISCNILNYQAFPYYHGLYQHHYYQPQYYHPLQGYQQYQQYVQPALPPQPYVQLPVVHQSSQFHAQDEFGNLQYGYNNINSVKHEVGNTYGGVSGGYSYVDAAGQIQTVQYVADNEGFKVADSRLPVAPTYNPEPLTAPEDTPEVVEARDAHMKAWESALEAANDANDDEN